ncbi:MAG: AtpZ/AtpI family protein [Burkholderiales bacterium]|nr:AtpZ/AtpI family protein [Burkholderiales bacterium]
MTGKENNNWWRPAVLVFSEVSTWIAFPVIFALIAGKALDERFLTKPWIFIAFTCFGFLISTYGIMKTVKKFTDNIKKEEDKNK